MYAPEVTQMGTPPGAAPTIVIDSGALRFLSRFSDEQLSVVWRFSGLGELTGDPEAPYPGRRVMAKFVQPIEGSWRDILRRAVRTAGNRRDLAALASLLRTLTVRPVGTPLPAPAPLDLSPQWGCHPPIPARAP
ncbi:hypothetical protein ACGFZ9_50035 [Streptomyces mirabilis]|uniref:hypothetical protein n=1 Tax=Streptomyces mirabilis TaxID=68239 RepID=UPI00371E481B